MLKVLVVDDDADQLDQLEMQLGAAGYEVHVADGYSTAMESLALDSPDLAIVDLMMEEPDAGFRLSYEIKKVNPQMPIIMISGVTHKTGMEFDAITEEERAWIKADAFLSKPVRLEQLRHEIERLTAHLAHS